MIHGRKNIKLGVNLLKPGPRLIKKKEFTGPQSRRGWETLN